MKTLKTIDLLAQSAIACITLLRQNNFYYFLFVLGGWQVLSCLVHVIAARKMIRNDSRTAYQYTLIVMLCIGWMLAYFMVFIGVAMAIWYFITCLYETVFSSNRQQQIS